MLTSKQIEFCKQYINGLDASNAYSIAFNKENNGSIRSASSRLLKRKEIQSYILELQEQNRKIVETANEKALECVIKGTIANATERMQILTKIMRGEAEVIEQIGVANIGAIDIIVKPSFSEQRAAIAELNKMDGSYAPTKQEHKIETKTTFIKLPDGTEVEL